jgi:hypothetical protein
VSCMWTLALAFGRRKRQHKRRSGEVVEARSHRVHVEGLGVLIIATCGGCLMGNERGGDISMGVLLLWWSCRWPSPISHLPFRVRLVNSLHNDRHRFTYVRCTFQTLTLER